jgi:hypothetical protein
MSGLNTRVQRRMLVAPLPAPAAEWRLVLRSQVPGTYGRHLQKLWNVEGIQLQLLPLISGMRTHFVWNASGT